MTKSIKEKEEGEMMAKVGSITVDLNMDEILHQSLVNNLTDLCHKAACDGGWWSDIHTGEKLERNKGELLMLMVSEIAEAMEGERKNLMDDKLPHRKMVEVELADTLIRIFDYAGAYDLDLGGALLEKLEYNRNRADHKPENRKQANGKKF